MYQISAQHRSILSKEGYPTLYILTPLCAPPPSLTLLPLYAFPATDLSVLRQDSLQPPLMIQL